MCRCSLQNCNTAKKLACCTSKLLKGVPCCSSQAVLCLLYFTLEYLISTWLMREQTLAQGKINQSINPGVLCRRHHEAELRQSREECWGRQQELAAVREKLSNLKTTLEDRRKDIVSYKVTPCGSICLLPPSCPLPPSAPSLLLPPPPVPLSPPPSLAA